RRVRDALVAALGTETVPNQWMHFMRTVREHLPDVLSRGRPSLYTFRHQLGAELKSMKLDRRAIAYIMGHQSTQSVEVYGDRRKSRGGIGITLTGQEASRFQGRENHRDAPEGMPESKVPPALRTPETAAPDGADGRDEAPSIPGPGPGVGGPSF
ncbi:MAG: hypothetical protein LC667_05640, partial [Thioalkalivibrio sp.]|nr:hypothetical protein [Thioalkalivibrio sp.]